MNDYERIALVIRYLDEHHTEQPDLATLAAYLGLSRFHFHRLFFNWAAITPKDFLQCLTLAHARELLHQGKSVLDASLISGLSGPGRLHDLCVALEAASPGELKSGGEGWTIAAGFADSPFGLCLVRDKGSIETAPSREDSVGSDTIRAAPALFGDWDLSAGHRLSP